MDFAKKVLAANWSEWEIVGDAEIGKGSYGKVYKIKREYVGNREQFAALKVIRFSDTTDCEHINEMVEEIELMTELKGNTNIVSYEDHKVIEDEDNLGCTILLRMELLTPFSEYIKTKELDNQEIVRLGIDICKALELLQKKKIIHRDIKPQNIFVSENGNFKLGDFGSARSLDMTHDVMTIAGSWPYMAPEVVKFEPYGKRADIYSLGTVLYELLNNGCKPHYTSQKPTAKEAETALQNKLMGKKLSPPSNADDMLSEIVMKACEFDSKKRFSSATEMMKELEKWIPSEESREQLTKRIKEKIRDAFSKINRKKALIILVCIVLVVAIISGLLIALKINADHKEPEKKVVAKTTDYAEIYSKNKFNIETAVIEYIKSTTKDEILKICCTDYDFDGTEEAFAITGTYDSEFDSYENCTVYYANDVSCTKIRDEKWTIAEYDGAIARIVENEDNRFFVFQTTGYYSLNVYTAYNNEAKEISVFTDYDCSGLFCKNNAFYTYDQSDNKDVMLKVKRTQFGYAQCLIPYLVTTNDTETAQIFAENESVWLDSYVSSFTFIDLDGEAPLELATLNSSEDNDYSSYIAFYKADVKNKTVEQILCNDYIECGYLSDFTYMDLYCNIYSEELIYSVNNNYFKLINEKIFNFSEDIVKEGDNLLYSSCFAVTYGEYAYDKDFLALSYARFKYDGYGEDTSSNYGSMQDAYKAVLNNYNQNSEYISELDGYFMFDIDDNDIHELIVVRNYQMIECCYDFYTYSDGRPIFVGSIFDSHSSLYVVENGKQLNLQSAYMGYENIMLIGLSEYRIDTLMIFEKEYEPDSFDDYSKVDGIFVDLFAFYDLSLIENPELIRENYDKSLQENEITTQLEERTTRKSWLSSVFR